MWCASRGEVMSMIDNMTVLMEQDIHFFDLFRLPKSRPKSHGLYIIIVPIKIAIWGVYTISRPHFFVEVMLMTCNPNLPANQTWLAGHPLITGGF